MLKLKERKTYVLDTRSFFRRWNLRSCQSNHKGMSERRSLHRHIEIGLFYMLQHELKIKIHVILLRISQTVTLENNNLADRVTVIHLNAD